MPALSVLMGQANAGATPVIWRQEGATDAGTPYDIVAESVWVPAQPGANDYMFYAVYLTLTWTMAVTLRVSAQVDDDAVTETINGWAFAPLGPELVLAGQAERLTKTFEFPMMTTMTRGGLELGRNAMRGRRARIRVETVGGIGAGSLIIDGVGIEREALIESLAQEGP